MTEREYEFQVDAYCMLHGIKREPKEDLQAYLKRKREAEQRANA